MRVKPLWTAQFGPRKANTVIDTLVIHTMYNPEAKDYFSPVLCREWLDRCEVSTHYILDRNGDVWQTVLEQNMAWHAGQSQMPFRGDSRVRVNDFSIGVELLATETSGVTAAQYQALAALTHDIGQRHPLKRIVGHCDIAPGRKTDPWQFDWNYYKEKLQSYELGDLVCGHGRSV